jgi:hypothetical protein
MAFDVQSALERAKVPGFRSAYRAGEDEELPDPYAIYALRQTPEDIWDDEPHAIRYGLTLNLLSRGNLLEIAARVIDELLLEGFQLQAAEDAYADDADLYVLAMEFQGVMLL